MHKRHPHLAAAADLPLELKVWLRVRQWLEGMPSWAERLYNTGSPMSRRRRERLHSSLLDNCEKKLRWPRQAVFMLRISPACDPVDYAYQLLEKNAYQTLQQALEAYGDLPVGLHYCHTWQPPKMDSGPQPVDLRDELRTALILGMCGRNFYAPDRPVIWTEKRLKRAVALYRPGGFYED